MEPTYIATPARPGILQAVFVFSLAALVLLTLQIVLAGNFPADSVVLLAAMSFRNASLTQVISVLTFMGSAIPTFLICVGLSLIEWRAMTRSQPKAGIPTKRPRMGQLHIVIWPLLAYIGALITNLAMRLIIGRIPPQVESIVQLLPELQTDFQRYSYPSGHAMTVFVAYGALAISAYRHSFLYRSALVLGLIMIVGVGFGRLYLGVHWPSDVLGGYLLSIIWLSLALKISWGRIPA